MTAKALKDDREKCIEAGASDYLPKPIDNDRLIELIRMWVAPRGGDADVERTAPAASILIVDDYPRRT